ncbi:hypothetical protein P153DRAFT_145694 [Dothidotthia symphoricarpi CBS 119687]|uniref:Uncharacterized protein n=1 Tax=Dothidotthia symphoricarpi CBS 119687 TaxID=1392245 RepID=A0A6A5ZY96_9PLEO|nr:uncharacterized protein P153DRAFT_145694 [Dothidotthia symphoricarpi CBS 119687]KAF2123757.1 hypothetical protein P153DRAFT_145694 [Dothidotthia symphoricarpi CBS 119687]
MSSPHRCPTIWSFPRGSPRQPDKEHTIRNDERDAEHVHEKEGEDTDANQLRDTMTAGFERLDVGSVGIEDLQGQNTQLEKDKNMCLEEGVTFTPLIDPAWRYTRKPGGLGLYSRIGKSRQETLEQANMLAAEVAPFKAEITQLEAKVEKLEEEKKHDQEKALEQIDTLTAEVAQSKAEVAQLEAKVEELEEEKFFKRCTLEHIETLTAEVGQLKAENAQSKAKVEKLEEEKKHDQEKALEQTYTLIAEVGQLKAENAQLKAENAQLKAENAQSKAKVKKQKEERKELIESMGVHIQWVGDELRVLEAKRMELTSK